MPAFRGQTALVTTQAVLDREQLREITLGDYDLMRDILSALLEDTAVQMALLNEAVSRSDAGETMRLAHYSKGACATVGASSAAAILLDIEQDAAKGNFESCGASMRNLIAVVELLRNEAAQV